MEPPPPPDHGFHPVKARGVEVLDDPLDEILESPVHHEERRPNVQKRFSAMSFHDDVQEVRPRTERRPIDVLPEPQDYIYYRVEKEGEDWGSAIPARIRAPIAEIEKKARKGRGGDGPILEQMTKMARLRRDQIEDLVYRANMRETGDSAWEVVYVKTKRIEKRNGKFEVPEMDVILGRTRGRRRRPKSFGGDVVDVRERRVKEKIYADDVYMRPRKDSVLDKLEDPVANRPLFEHDGRPMNDLGPVNFENGSLPPHIPREKPLGAKPEKEKKRDKSEKRSKSRDKGHHHDDDDVVVVEEGADFRASGALFAELDDRHGRQRAKSPRPRGHPQVEGRRSHSRSRPPAGSRGHSRARSHSRRESVHFPNRHTQEYLHGSSASSQTSDISHFGRDDAESSNTSFTSGGGPRRGSLHHSRPGPERVYYKQHHRGPTRSVSYADDRYHGDDQFVTPARTPRRDYVYRERPEVRYERRPLVRQMTAPVDYHGGQDLVPVRRFSDQPVRRYVIRDAVPPIAMFPDEEQDVYFRDQINRRSSRIEDYQNDRIRDDWLRERDIEERQRAAYYDDRWGTSRQVYIDAETGSISRMTD
ncbi:hypothetical protein LTR10_018918 [Elasticomyces elasticus]|uniref:Uncharacterized protein n=1 Tax=Exophiala sideris TaxID=1016849 RepID=A0ABR0JIY4_9EURO|nr:hypothetical protein LTR10_018918 [Elasticomyces elasticus]KAK5034437.1 hypothetical protein LTS07_003358 [Exophiala sideris]KAK5042734.1 hypothetical protein LTR13_001582 [Exophiala sideris]KAK5065817.1 hypothetical protein LTR69_003367 [Exophiala sideris]KAK5185722.1 hypothetical protein LTR44_001771 [Eurotiomycetes sp. CCFEE 6388]